MLRVEQAVVDHLKRDAGLNERLIPAVDIVFDFAGIEPSSLLRINHADARQRYVVAEILLPARQPLINPFDWPQPALIMQDAAELGEPWPQPVGHSVSDPQADFRLTLDTILPAVGFFDPNAEDADNGFATHGCAK